MSYSRPEEDQSSENILPAVLACLLPWSRSLGGVLYDAQGGFLAKAGICRAELSNPLPQAWLQKVFCDGAYFVPAKKSENDAKDKGESLCMFPLRTEQDPVGILVLSGEKCSKKKLDSLETILSLVAFLIQFATQEQKQVHKVAALLKTHQAKSLFIANLSHEIRTPMNGVLGFLELLSLTPVSEIQKKYIDTARASADILMRVMNEILDISKIEAGKVELENVAFDPVEVMETTLATLMPLAQKKNLPLYLESLSALPRSVLGDPSRLKQILMNLLNNAIKFTEHGAIRLFAECIERDPAYVILRFGVADTGIGIPKDKIQRLFHVFTQIDESHSRLYGGTGLGLAISKKLVELMGGEIWVSPDKAQGAQFNFTLRFGNAEDRPSPRNYREILSGKGVLLLTAEDSLAAMMQQSLEAMGAVVCRVKNGYDALITILGDVEDAYPIRVCIVDVHSPLLSASDFCSALAALPQTKDIQTILLGAKEEASRMEGYQNNPNRMLVTPVREENLFNVLYEVLRT